MNQVISSFYTVQTVLMQEVLISHTSKLIVILAGIITLINLIFDYFMPTEYDEANVKKNLLPIKNMIVSLGVSIWSQYFFRPNVLYKLANEWVVDTTIYDWYFVRSVELVIATVIVMRLASYLVKQINVIVREKEVVVLELLKWPKPSSDNWQLGRSLYDLSPEEIEKIVAKINRKKIKKEKNQMLKEKMKQFVKEGIKISVMVLFYAVLGVMLLATLSGNYDLSMIACSLLLGIILLIMILDSYFNRKIIKTKVVKKISKWLITIKKEGMKFRKNNTSGESLIIWSLSAIKLIYTVLKLVLLYLYLYFGKQGLGIAWKKLSEYLVQSGMDPLKAESMKINAVGLLYTIGYTVFISAATISLIYWIIRRDDFSFKDSTLVRTTKLLFKSTVLVLVIGVLFYIVSDPLFIDPEPLTVTVLWAIISLNVGMILNKVFLNVLVNRAEKVMFYEECKMVIESNFIDDDRLLSKMKNYFLVKESWKSLIVLENTSYSKNGKESFWLVEKTYRFRYTLFKFTRGLHIRLSVLDSLDKEDEGNSPKKGDSIFKAGAEEQLSKNIISSPHGTIKSSETMIDFLKEKGYEVRILDVDAPGDTYNPADSIKK